MNPYKGLKYRMEAGVLVMQRVLELVWRFPVAGTQGGRGVCVCVCVMGVGAAKNLLSWYFLPSRS